MLNGSKTFIYLFIYSDHFCLEINLCVFIGHLLEHSWSPCQHTSPESTELHQSINRFLQQSYLPRDITSQLGIWPCRCCFSLTFMLLRCQHNIDYHTFFWFSARKVWRLLCGHMPVWAQNVSLQGGLSLRHHKWAEEQPEYRDTEPSGLKMGLILMECGQWIVLLEALLANGFLFSSVFCPHSRWILGVDLQCEGTWQHLALFRIERHQWLVPQCPTTRRMGLLMW